MIGNIRCQWSIVCEFTKNNSLKVIFGAKKHILLIEREINMERERLERGMIQVYTGNGKGKTTASLGLALRAIGHGYRVYMIQFMKGDIEYGELISAKIGRAHV